MMNRPIDVLVALDVCVDLVVRGDVLPRFGQTEQMLDDYLMEMGGSAAIFASQCAKLGLHTLGVGVAGADALGRMFIDKLVACGADVSGVIVDDTAITGLGIALCQDNDRAILTYSGTIDRATPAMIGERLPYARHLHIASFYLMQSMKPHWPALARLAKESGATVSLDTNWDPEERWDGLDSLAGLVDVLLPNENEALAFTGESDVEQAARALAELFPLVVVKRSERGALACHGGQLIRMLAPKTTIADTIGAGDSFDGGFMYGWLNGKPLGDCLRIGCLCGAGNVARFGGIAGQPVLAGLPAELQ